MKTKLKTALIATIIAITTAGIDKNNTELKKTEKMITVKVTYGVKKEFASKNKENIALFIKDLKAMNSKEFTYNVYTLEDQTTFIHISSYANKEIQEQVLNTPSFKEFQRQRDESGLTKAHNLKVLNFVATSQNE